MNGYVLLVEVESKKPVQLWINGCDTVIENCCYFDRMYTNRLDGLFQGRKWLRFPLPIEPKGIEVKAVNGLTNNPDGIKIHKLLSMPLNQGKIPEQDTLMVDFMQFTCDIAQYGGMWSQGTYLSPRGLWKMHLVSEIQNLDDPKLGPVNTPASVNRKTGEIYWVQDAIRNLTVPNRFFVNYHEENHFGTGSQDEAECDNWACNMTHAYGFGKYEIQATLIRLFGDCDEKKDKNCGEKLNRAIKVQNWLQAQPDLN
jgi:hypothetical protein